MTIGKKLYLGFGANSRRSCSFCSSSTWSRCGASTSRGNTVRSHASDCRRIENVRFQMMENRLYLGNYLLSGDLRDEDKTNKGVGDLLVTL